MKQIKESILVLKYPNVTLKPKGKSSKQQYITPELFEKHILWLLEWRYNPLTAEEFNNFIFKGYEIPFKSYLLVFENGYKNIMDYAFPILKRYKIPALIFLVANYIGDYNRWEDSKEKILSIDDIVELNKTSMFAFGSQSKTNRDLTTLSDAELHDEIFGSKYLLEEILRYNVEFFNYPYNRYDERVKEKIIEAGIPVAFVNRLAQITSLEDFHSIPAIKISEADSWLQLIRKLRKVEY